MQHLDDGYLQSWLDRDRSGITPAEAEDVEAHVARCEVCRARLAALEASSERARSLLAVAAPSREAAPDFAEVVRRARRRSSPGRAGRGWVAAGWAASLVAAVGLGWLSHGLLGPGVEAPPVAVDLPAEQAEPDREAVAAAEFTPADTPAMARARATEPGDAQDPPADTADIADPAPGIAIAPTTFSDVPAVAEAEEARPPLFVQGRVRSGDGTPLAFAQVSIPGTGIGTLTQADGSFALRLPTDAVTASVDKPLTLSARQLGYESETLPLVPAGGDTVSVDFQLSGHALALDEARVAGAPMAARARTARVREAWVPADREHAESEAGFVLGIVPDLPVLEIELGGPAGAVAIRVRQALDSGATLTLVQWSADGPALDPVLPSGQPAATARTRGLVIAGSAPISPDSLTALLARVR